MQLACRELPPPQVRRERGDRSWLVRARAAALVSVPRGMVVRARGGGGSGEGGRGERARGGAGGRASARWRAHAPREPAAVDKRLHRRGGRRLAHLPMRHHRRRPVAPRAAVGAHGRRREAECVERIGARPRAGSGEAAGRRPRRRHGAGALARLEEGHEGAPVARGKAGGQLHRGRLVQQVPGGGGPASESHVSAARGACGCERRGPGGGGRAAAHPGSARASHPATRSAAATLASTRCASGS